MGRGRGQGNRKMVQVETEKLGNFYFNEPKVIDIASRKPVSQMQPQNSMRPHIVAGRQVTYGEGACRMFSSHGISGYTPPNTCEYHLSRWPNRMDRDAYLDIMETQGFGEGAIVCRKYQPLSMMAKPHRWGVILLIHNYSASSEYQPYLVKWFMDGACESVYAEDLYVIHASMDDTLVFDILEAQGCDVPGSPV